MNAVMIKKINDDVKVIFEKKKTNLPKEIQDKVDLYWDLVNSNDRKFRRGDVFNIVTIEETNDLLKIYVELTDYAHYLYTTNNDIPEGYACRVIFTAALVKTSDNRLIFGQMAKNTSTPGRLQCAGGGIDRNDVKGNIIDLHNNIVNELYEELGIKTDDNQIVKVIKPKYLKSGGTNNFLAVIYVVELKITENEFRSIYDNYVEELLKKSQTPEFDSIVILPNNHLSIKTFLDSDVRPRVDYLEKLLLLELSYL